MPEYRFSGLYSFAPDRGSPHGHQKPVTKEFVADDDKKAVEWVKTFRKDRETIILPQLVKIVVKEQTECIEL